MSDFFEKLLCGFVRIITCDNTFGLEDKSAPSPYPHWPAFEQKCRKAGLGTAAIAAFKYNYEKLASGADLMIPEATISPVSSLPDYNSLTAEDPSLLGKCVMLKLNGGLGTGMGLEKAKSLLKLKGDDTFLDFIAHQVLDLRSKTGQEIQFLLMNSFATSADTLAYLSKYTTLKTAKFDLEFQQNKVRSQAAHRRAAVLRCATL